MITIKFVGFELIYYSIKFSDVSYFMIFNDLVFIFLSMNC